VKTAIISDIHSNLPALVSVLAKIDALGADRIVTCGDLVGYGAQPNEVIDKVKDLLAIAIRGNHDTGILDPREAETFNRFAREAIFWTRGALTKENTDYLRKLKDQERIDDIILAHGSLLDPDEYIYTPFQAARSLELSPCRITAIGHTHYPEIYRYEPATGLCRDILSSEGEVELEEGYRYLVNVGSVGQSRDGDWRAGFALYNTEGRGMVTIHRVEYDVRGAIEKINEVGLPSMLADRLYEGR
jgi:putative phosphoesterase